MGRVAIAVLGLVVVVERGGVELSPLAARDVVGIAVAPPAQALQVRVVPVEVAPLALIESQLPRARPRREGGGARLGLPVGVDRRENGKADEPDNDKNDDDDRVLKCGINFRQESMRHI